MPSYTATRIDYLRQPYFVNSPPSAASKRPTPTSQPSSETAPTLETSLPASIMRPTPTHQESSDSVSSLASVSSTSSRLGQALKSKYKRFSESMEFCNSGCMQHSDFDLSGG
ncbi:hypothetical protein B0A50_06592 [Salinomyces thailandicus]|uniref:Uncharacterized protein n=1 Tax=Salinomyces thailandicus TaxID=706561 RepID=A0A4U0TRR0_9PEZI|nr:hypothetical protein B0A50_06592 [Salinomyces thailandica]